MIRGRILLAVVLFAMLVAVAATVAQIRRGRDMQRRQVDRSEYPTWENDAEYQDDVFTFVRIQYDSYSGYSYRRRRGDRWQNDYPDSDLNFSYRLQELTSLKVDPDGKVFRLTDPEIFDYPFLYMNGVGSIRLSDAEATALRRYLLHGGFLMLDDFWGYEAWENVYDQMRYVFPDRQPRELPLSHEIFHLVYDLDQRPQVPSIRFWLEGFTYEEHGPGSEDGPHFQGFFDDNNRLMAILCHNNDLGDGWEREGENQEYFHDYSERWSYPMGINIIVYAMTH